ncbi:protein S40-5-like [Phragmites australis]|uniref:protein S40-5-like n=1 Tax=Phragmites australis TaxID=29695 RepID=UPI002D768AA0|nr:protein S40-5-like [Phragmites australis]
MAKARRQPLAAAERLLGFPCGGLGGAPAGIDDDLPDLAEADIWYYSAEGPGPNTTASRQGEAEEGTTGVGRRAVQGGLSRAFGDGRQLAASAPVEVPAWPSRFAVEPEPALPLETEEEEKDDGAGWVPPHLYLAQRQARASVVEGAGRTLKGRDMSRVRDAVWSRIGFDG